MDPILCIQILEPNGDIVFVPKHDYDTNPTVGTIVVYDKPHSFDPVVRETCEYWQIETPVAKKKTTVQEMLAKANMQEKLRHARNMFENSYLFRNR